MSSTGRVDRSVLAGVAVEDVDALRAVSRVRSPARAATSAFSASALSTRDAGPGARRQPRGTSLLAETGGWVVAFAGFYRDPRMASGRRSHSRSPTRCKATGYGPECWNTWRAWPARQGIGRSTPTCSAEPADARCVPRLGLCHDHRLTNAGSFRRHLGLSVTPVRSAGRPRSQAAADGLDEGVFRTRAVAVMVPIGSAAGLAPRFCTTWWRQDSRGPIVAGAPDGP